MKSIVRCHVEEKNHQKLTMGYVNFWIKQGLLKDSLNIVQEDS